MRTLIVGAGLVGAHIAKTMIARGFDVILVDYQPTVQEYAAKVIGGDSYTFHLLESPLLSVVQGNELLKYYGPGTLVVSAGSLAPLYRRASGIAIANEASMTASWVLAARQCPYLRKVVLVSSFAVYGGAESKMEDNHRLMPRSPYGVARLYGEYICRAALTNVFLTIVRPCGIIGPVPKRGGSWMSKKISEILFDPTDPFCLTEEFSDGIEWLDVRDLAELIARCAETSFEPGFDIVNASRGEVTDAEELTKAIALITHRFGITSSSHESRISPMDNRKAISVYGFRPHYSLLSALQYIRQFGGENVGSR